MPRAAGTSGTYELAVIDAAGVPKGRSTQLPSVTTILKALPKYGLDWWGMKIGIKGVLELIASEELPSLDISDEEAIDEAAEAVYAKIKQRRIYTPYAVLNKAGGRGTDIHDVAETLLSTGKMPPKESIPDEQIGYAKALRAWYMGRAKHLDVIAVEVPVFSLRFNYAGTLDAILHDPDIDLYYLIDFKTSKGIYESHLLQIAAYEYAARERGYIPPDAEVLKCVVRLGVNGVHEVGNSHCDIEDFLCVMRTAEMLERLKGVKLNDQRSEQLKGNPASVTAAV